EIDVGGIHVPEELDPGLGRDVAGAHCDSFDASLAAGLRDVDRIFEKDHRIVVSEGDGPRAARDGCLRDCLGRSFVLQPVAVARFRDVPVLAELADEVAPGGTEGEHRRPGQEMVERLLLDRVDAEARGASIGGEHDLVVVAGAHVAESALAVMETAIARAEIALDAAVLELVPVAARDAGKELIHARTDLARFWIILQYLGIA